MNISRHELSEDDVDALVLMVEGYSNADLVTLVKEVAMMPVREIPTE